MIPTVPDCYYRVTVRAVILDETKKKFLIGRDNSGKWMMPGGGLEWKETPEECLTRELKEEMGLNIVSFKSEPSYVIKGLRDDSAWVVDILHEVVVDDSNFIPSPECQEIQFVTTEEAQKLTIFSSLKRFIEVFDSAKHSN